MTSNRDAFWKIHEDLPRQGPGSDATTENLFSLAAKDGNLKDAIDMGCGPGSSALLLASHGLHVRCIDTHEPFLEELQKHARRRGLSKYIEAKNASISDVPYPDSSFNLVWSEGTAYLIGWRNALALWKRLLRPQGKLVVTDSFWLTDQRSPDAVTFWKADPSMTTVEQATAIATNLGYKLVMTYLQPDSDWFDEYYTPMEDKISRLGKNASADMKKAIEDTNFEISVRRRYGNEYGHVGFIFELAEQ